MQAFMTMPGMTFGCDPELFIQDKKTGKFVSPDGLIPGTKAEPYKVPGGAVQQDGMAAEFNIDPSSSFLEFNSNITKVLGHLLKMLPRHLQLTSLPAVVFDEDVWEGASEKAKELGCSPDFNAWTGSVNPPPNPDNASSPRLRTASGHLHVGWTEDANVFNAQHIENCRDLVKQYDFYLGAWSLLKDTDNVRRQLYGKAGACRFKSYGVEYRVLSNFWVGDVRTRLAVWNRMQVATWKMRDNFLPEIEADIGLDFKIKDAIDNSELNPDLKSFFRVPVVTMGDTSNIQTIEI